MLGNRRSGPRLNTRRLTRGFIATDFSPHPQCPKENKAYHQDYAGCRKGDVLVTVGKVRLVPHAVVNRNPDDTQKREQEKAKKTHGESHQDACAQPEVPQWNTENGSLGLL